ncbi:IPT/TIG domain-containing protein [Sinomonas sp. ASV322]|uniref:IPT/TIG domain-containing protein n=1 Tax=Sinomonas sp. ASV322 TaxID=3041920 RepID=UPI0027DD3712|nr:IPT/TIG domain-containing protein [Sinomonas sp. ASV322]MDQ4504391.1 IPT/TIG domain-containing protein [Sinomonas sp. ASV322]
MRWPAVIAAAAVFLTGSSVAAIASPLDSSSSNGRFLSGTLLTSAGTLNSVASLNGAATVNTGSATPVIQSVPLDLTALSAVNLAAGVNAPLLGNTGLLTIGAVNQYSESDDLGVSRSASGAVSNAGAVSVNGSGGFPADASINLAPLLSQLGGSSVFDTANVHLGAITGVAALTAPNAPPAASCANLSAPVNCRGYNVASAMLNLHSPAISGLVGSLNSAANTAQGTITTNLTGTITAAVNSAVNQTIVNNLGVNVSQSISVNLGLNLQTALAPVLAVPITQNGVTLDLSSGTVTVDLAQVTGPLNGRAPNSPVLDAATITIIGNTLTSILNQLQTNVNNAVQAAINSATVTITDTLTLSDPIDGPLGTSVVTIGGAGTTLASLAAGVTPPVVVNTAGLNANGQLLIGGVLSTLGPAIGILLEPLLMASLPAAIASAVTTVNGALDPLITGLGTTLQPAVQLIGSLANVVLNVQEPGTGGYTYKEVAVRATLGSGGSLGTVDLGMAQVGPNVRSLVPQISGLSPIQGPEAGGTSVTMTGFNLTGATAVTVAGTSYTPAAGPTPAAGQFVVNPDGTITFVTAAHASGPVNVTVTTPQGVSAPATFTFLPIPANLSLAPNSGPVGGGQTVTISGTDVTGATQVTFGGATYTRGLIPDPTHFVDNGNNTLTLVTDPHAAGPVGVVVTNANGSSAPATYTYVAAPASLALSPNAGPVAGGQQVTVSGSDLASATSLAFGGTTFTPGAAAAGNTSFTVNPNGTLTLFTPANAAGGVNVTVTNPGGASAPLPYTYVAAPANLALSPNAGPTAGGTSVTLSGTALAGATSIAWGGATLAPGATADATHFVDNGNGTLTVSTPTHAAGPVNVTVTTPGGTSGPGVFTYVAAPANLTLSPNEGPTAGGQQVTLSGTGLTGATAVDFGGTAFTPGTAAAGNTSFTANPNGTITLFTPAHAAAGVPVTVTTPGGTTAPAPYTYVAAPANVGLTPNAGPVAGGQQVTVSGTALAGATSVDFGGVTFTPGAAAAGNTSFTANPDGTLTLFTPAHAAGGAPVTVTTPGGTSAPATYTYEALPANLALNPNAGPLAGGQQVTLSGDNLAGATSVSFGGTAFTPGTAAAGNTSFMVNPNGTITLFTPAHAAGGISVTVTTSGGTTSPAPYTYVAAPANLAVSPNAGPAAGGQQVTLSGSNLAAAMSVVFGGVTFTPGTAGAGTTQFTVNSDGTITLFTPAHAAGAANVTVTTPGGTTGPATYTFVAAPVVASLTPNQGPTAGGTSVVVAGSNFGGATSVDFGGTTFTPGAAAAGTTQFTVNPDGTITLFSPAHAVGSVDVTVTTPGGTSPATAYAYVAAPAITGLNPDTGPADGGNTAVISGSDLAGANGVTVDGTQVPFTVNNDGTISITMPAHAAGSVDVVVTGPGGSSAPAAYTYTGTASAASLAMTGGGLPIVVTIAGIGLLLVGAGLLLFARRRMSR